MSMWAVTISRVSVLFYVIFFRLYTCSAGVLENCKSCLEDVIKLFAMTFSHDLTRVRSSLLMSHNRSYFERFHFERDRSCGSILCESEIDFIGFGRGEKVRLKSPLESRSFMPFPRSILNYGFTAEPGKVWWLSDPIRRARRHRVNFKFALVNWLCIHLSHVKFPSARK